MLWACALASLAAAVFVRSPPLRRLAAACGSAEAAAEPTALSRLRGMNLLTSPVVAAVGGAVAVVQFVPGTAGVLAAPVAAIVVYRWVSNLESIAERRRRERMARDLPVAVDLLVAALSAGRPPGQALAAVATAIGGPLGDEFSRLAARIELGADAAGVWGEVARDPVLGPVGRSFSRASQSGASVTLVLGRCVEDLRRQRHTEANRVARSVGVRTAAPLGLCFLPAFIAVGVVPTIIGAFWKLVL